MAKSADQWFNEYGESHQNPVNKTIHWIAVPTIFMTVVGLFWSIPVPALFESIPYLNWATIGLVAAIIFYLYISISLGIGMAIFSVVMVAIVSWFQGTGILPVWQMSLILFVFMWILQFIGHAIEGKKPSFFKDVQFLLIGPAWLMGFIYRKLGIRY
jgi:uncharacterized membrane protein YGL010W